MDKWQTLWNSSIHAYMVRFTVGSNHMYPKKLNSHTK